MAQDLFDPFSVFGFGIRVDVQVAHREVTYPWQTVSLGQTTDATTWNGRLVTFSYCVAKLMAYILLSWRFMPDYVEEGTEAEIGAAANIEPWLT
ncbi:hypothetical protein CsSME_00040881 [Camellia sinensis var. sinensis]